MTANPPGGRSTTATAATAGGHTKASGRPRQSGRSSPRLIAIPPGSSGAETAGRPSGGVERAAERGDVGGAEDHAVARGDVDEVEVDSRPRDLACQVGEHPRAVLDVDDN